MFRGIGRQFREQAAFTVVIVVLLAAFGYLVIYAGHWRRAAAVVAVAVLAAGVFRLVLSSAYAGLLAIRNRWLDAICYLVLGGVILGVALRLH
jgi:TM2 domain-containing membrane protein YozV